MDLLFCRRHLEYTLLCPILAITYRFVITLGGNWRASIGNSRPELDVDVFLLREAQHLLEAFRATEPWLLDATEGRAQEMLADECPALPAWP